MTMIMSKDAVASTTPRVLLVNPWIHDFAAYDFWARPLGLFTVGGLLRAAGVAVELLDLTDPRSPHLPAALRPRRKPTGHGRFAHQIIPRPAILPYINRCYRRYGLPPEQARAALASFSRPQAILVTSMMTYWYPGVCETIALMKEQWPDVPVVLGGVYATLCADHAHLVSGADAVLPGPIEDAWSELVRLSGAASLGIPGGFVPPAHDLSPQADAAALRTSQGCPFACPYCGVKRLHPTFIRHPPEQVEAEVRHLTELGITDIGLVDDAFLIDADRALDILERLARLPRPVRLHAASGLSIRGLDARVARAMRRAGFTTIRLGLETVDERRQREWGSKVDTVEFLAAVECLVAAGYARRELGVYLLVGLPGQSRAEVEHAVDFVLAHGLRPHLTDYSPVPGSPLFAAAQAGSPYDLAEPLFHNPTLLPCATEELNAQAVNAIRRRINDAVR